MIFNECNDDEMIHIWKEYLMCVCVPKEWCFPTFIYYSVLFFSINSCACILFDLLWQLSINIMYFGLIWLCLVPLCAFFFLRFFFLFSRHKKENQLMVSLFIAANTFNNRTFHIKHNISGIILYNKV